VRLLRAFAFSTKLCWFEPTKVISLKMQTHAVNARLKRLSQLSLTHMLKSKRKMAQNSSFKVIYKEPRLGWALGKPFGKLNKRLTLLT